MIWLVVLLQTAAIVVLVVKYHQLERSVLKTEDLPYIGSGCTKSQFEAEVEKIAKRAKMRTNSV